MRTFVGLFVLSFVLLALLDAFAGEVYAELNDQQKAAIQKGELVFFTENVAGSEWPKAFLYLRIDSTPEEAMAVFYDVERQTKYIPNIKKAKVSKVIDKRTREVDYTLNVPTFF